MTRRSIERRVGGLERRAKPIQAPNPADEERNLIWEEWRKAMTEDHKVENGHKVNDLINRLKASPSTAELGSYLEMVGNVIEEKIKDDAKRREEYLRIYGHYPEDHVDY